MPYCWVMHEFKCSFCPAVKTHRFPYFLGERAALPVLPDEPGTAGWTYISVGGSNYISCPLHKVNIAMIVDGEPGDLSGPVCEEGWHLRKGQWIARDTAEHALKEWH